GAREGMADDPEGQRDPRVRPLRRHRDRPRGEAAPAGRVPARHLCRQHVRARVAARPGGQGQRRCSRGRGPLLRRAGSAVRRWLLRFRGWRAPGKVARRAHEGRGRGHRRRRPEDGLRDRPRRGGGRGALRGGAGGRGGRRVQDREPVIPLRLCALGHVRRRGRGAGAGPEAWRPEGLGVAGLPSRVPHGAHETRGGAAPEVPGGAAAHRPPAASGDHGLLFQHGRAVASWGARARDLGGHRGRPYSPRAVGGHVPCHHRRRGRVLLGDRAHEAAEGYDAAHRLHPMEGYEVHRLLRGHWACRLPHVHSFTRRPLVFPFSLTP
ncbi:unnamed protein product, partial [Prorocentrum cordatum]